MFKQAPDEESAEPIATGGGDANAGGISPDGNWILFSRLNEVGSSTPMSLMRIPMGGGPPELVLRTPVQDYRCSKAPSIICVMADKTVDARQLTFYRLDFLKGQGAEVSRFGIDNTAQYRWDLSPDGGRIAIANSSEAQIHILSLNGGVDERKVTARGWKSLQSLNWATDGKGFFVGSPNQRSSALLYVDLNGNARILWEQKGDNGDMGTYAVPSRNGRHVAISGYAMSNNVWVIENF